MIVLIAESKSMSERCCKPYVGCTTPQFEMVAGEIIDGLRGKGVAELSSELKLGPKNALRLYEEIYNFSAEGIGCRAIEAYTGVVFKALDAATLESEAMGRLARSVLIVSSLYGLLRPTDAVKSYRFDFGMKAAPGQKALSAFWKPLTTDALIQHLESTGETEVLNLLPKDAMKCFDWKRIRGVADVYNIQFQEYKDCSKLGTPNSDKLKQLRGRLLRHITEMNILHVEDFRSIEFSDMSLAPELSCEEELVFVTA